MPKNGTIWKIVEGVAIAAILGAAGLTWQTREETKQMQIQLSNLCTTLPELKIRVDRLESESNSSKVKDVIIEGRIGLVERSIEILEKRFDSVSRSISKLNK